MIELQTQHQHSAWTSHMTRVFHAVTVYFADDDSRLRGIWEHATCGAVDNSWLEIPPVILSVQSVRTSCAGYVQFVSWKLETIRGRGTGSA